MLRKKRKPTIRKRPFLLFEILLAMGLIVLCLFPMIKTHAGIARAEQQQLRALHEEQEVEARFCAIKEALFERAYSWQELMHGVQGEGYTIEKVEQSTKNTAESGLIVAITFEVGKQEYQRRVYLEKARYHAH